MKYWYANSWDIGDSPDPPTAVIPYVLASEHESEIAELLTKIRQLEDDNALLALFAKNITQPGSP